MLMSPNRGWGGWIVDCWTPITLSISSTTTPPKCVAIAEQIKRDWNNDYKKVVLLEGIKDAGNLGTILRTADSVNLKQIVVTKETADVYNPKVVRSTMGAIFRINVIESDDILKTIKEIKKNKFKVLATSLGATESIYDVDFKKKAIVIGNEANGVSKQVLDVADNKVIIPMLGKAESLNASVATGVILYEYVRQKTRKW